MCLFCQEVFENNDYDTLSKHKENVLLLLLVTPHDIVESLN